MAVCGRPSTTERSGNMQSEYIIFNFLGRWFIRFVSKSEFFVSLLTEELINHTELIFCSGRRYSSARATVKHSRKTSKVTTAPGIVFEIRSC